MPDDGEQRPQGPPDYKVYRSRRGLLSRLRKPALPTNREKPSRSGAGDDAGARGGGSGGRRGDRGEPAGATGPGGLGGPEERGHRRGGEPRLPPSLGDGALARGRRRQRGPRLPRPRRGWIRAVRWIAIAALGWIALSLLAFAVSAQLQSFKLAGEARDALHGNPFLLPSAQTILVLGTDARPPDTKEPGAAPAQKCFDQQARGEKPHDPCEVGEFRADTLMLIRAGGGAFRKLSIPRDAYAEVPGHEPQKINGAYAYGGAALQIKTVEGFLDTQIDHVAIINFTGFEALIDAVGGVTVDVPHKLCADISGGAGGGQGGMTLHLGKGENTLNGEKALAYARIRKPSECPGPGKSAYSLGYSDFDRERAQQAVIAGIKGRLTDPLRFPYNFVKGPIIGWDAPKAFVSDMGFFTMPQLVLAAAIGGDSPANVLCRSEAECPPGPAGSLEVPDSVRRRAVNRLLRG